MVFSNDLMGNPLPVSHGRRVVAKFGIGLAVLIVAIGVLAGVASAREYKFHAHTNAYAKPACSGFQWTDEAGQCEGGGVRSSTAPRVSPFHSTGRNIPITISWSPARLSYLCGDNPCRRGTCDLFCGRP